MVIITSISELSQGAQSQVETWSEIIAEQTSGRLAIIFIDKLEGELRSYTSCIETDLLTMCTGPIRFAELPHQVGPPRALQRRAGRRPFHDRQPHRQRHRERSRLLRHARECAEVRRVAQDHVP